ncbi:MAG TPA: hypothetical protein VEI80_05825 [Candidatus Acidoferrales bacterium]|nr:hypothetical protein [Candidatus Acidoferrales bacterium]
MKPYGRVLSCLVVFLALTIPLAQIALALGPLSGSTFSPGTIVVPMDDKQVDRVHVYGFIHEFLRDNPGSQVSRIIEPPNVVLQTDLTPAGVLYQGGPFLIDQSFTSAVNAMLSNSTFAKVTITRLTTTFTSNRVLVVTQPTRILVISDGYWGKTFLTLERMGISYTQISTDQALANPSIINQYTLIVLDSPGWYGNPSAYSPLHRSQITAVYNAIQARVAAGNEVMYTDAAMFDLNSTFPGYVKLGNAGETGSWVSTMHNPAAGDSGFDSEFPSQYYNPGPNPNRVTIFTEEGVGDWVPNGVQPAHIDDVRILMDSTNYGIPKLPYSILAFYFPYGNGIVEGLALQPYEQLYPTYADYNGYYAVYQIYGNKFVEGITPDFSLSATPPTVTVSAGQSAGYQVTVTSLSSFSGTVNLGVTGLPSGAQAVFAPSSSVSVGQGQSATESLNILTSAATPTGSYNLTITGSSATPLLTHSVIVSLIVTAPIVLPPDFTVTIVPSHLYVAQGACSNFTITITSMNGFNSPVTLSVSGLPSGVTGRFVPSNVLTPPANGMVSGALEICTTSSVAPGNYTVVVTARSGTITHTATATLTIPRPTVPPLTWVVWLIIGMLLLAIGLALLALLLSGKGRKAARVVPAAVVGPVVPAPVLVPARGPMVRYVLPMPTVRCRYCGRVMPLHSVYCPFCGRPQVILAPPGAVLGRVSKGRNIIPVILALISGILVLLNAAALLSPSFWIIWSSIFFWLPVIGQSYAFMIGAIVGLTLVLGAIIMALGNGALADVIMFPFAIFSLLIGGGFIAGMLLGILAGILVLVRRSR